jgi:hypothetical protein
MLWVGAFTALSSWLSNSASGLLARTATAILLIGAAVVVVEYSILGYEVKRVADAWHTASGAERAHFELLAEVMFGISGGLFLSFIAWLLGLPYVLIGLAIVVGRTFPRWMGWLAVVGGSGALLGGTTRFLGLDLVPVQAVYGAFIVPLTLWLTGMGALMYRHGQSGGRHQAAPDGLQVARR